MILIMKKFCLVMHIQHKLELNNDQLISQLTLAEEPVRVAWRMILWIL